MTTVIPGDRSRPDRDLGRKRYGDEGYALEELVAEPGAAFVLADLDLTPHVREEHAAYVQSWLRMLKDDKRAIFMVASHAPCAADYLHGCKLNAARHRASKSPPEKNALANSCALN